ncbi:MAG: Trp biosynthesis-associated membrane protein [Egibacteraceae bacterium]
MTVNGTTFPPLAVGLAVIGGLLLVGATSGNWVVTEQVREVGGVPLAEPEGTAGIALAARGIAAGVLAVLGGLGLIVARGRGRRVLGALLCLVGTVTVVVVAVGVVRALDAPGRLTTAPWVAGLGAVAIAGAGVVAWRRPAPPPALGARYSIDGAAGQDQGDWGLASDEP